MNRQPGKGLLNGIRIGAFLDHPIRQGRPECGLTFAALLAGKRVIDRQSLTIQHGGHSIVDFALFRIRATLGKHRQHGAGLCAETKI